MNHIQNIAKLFKKPFVESALLESFDAGNLHLSSGKIVACDPIITNDKEAFSIQFPTGNFPVYIHKEKESQCIAYVEVLFSEKNIDFWQMAVTQNQNTEELSGDEIFGYPVESGMGCLMDEDTQQLLNELENNIFLSKGENFMGIYEEFFHEHFLDENETLNQFASLQPNEKKDNNIIAFETGFGEGFYASYIAFDKDRNPVKIITEFIEILTE